MLLRFLIIAIIFRLLLYSNIKKTREFAVRYALLSILPTVKPQNADDLKSSRGHGRCISP